MGTKINLVENQQQTQTTVSQLAGVMIQLTQNAEADRVAWQAEIRRIGEYLLSQPCSVQ